MHDTLYYTRKTSGSFIVHPLQRPTQPNILHPDPHLGTLSAQFACNESKLAIWLICPGLALAGNPGLADAADDNDARLRFRLPELASPVRLLDRERWKGEG